MSADPARSIRTLVVDDEPVARQRLREALAGAPGFEFAGSAADGPTAVRAIAELEPDLVLLDVQMPGLDGFGVIEQVGAAHMPPVVFVTAHDSYALRAFEVHALDYVTKPWDGPRLGRALERARDEVARRGEQRLPERLGALLAAHARGEPERLVVRSSGRILLLDLDELDWIAAAGNYLRLHAGSDQHLVRDTLSAMAARLPSPRFLRIHRSTLVRRGAVRAVASGGDGGLEVELRDGTRLAVGPRFAEALVRAVSE